MHERYNEELREVMKVANEEGRQSNTEYCGTEHILLALLKKETSVAGLILSSLGCDFWKMSDMVRKKMPEPLDEKRRLAAEKRLPQTPRARKVVEYAIEEARHLDQNYLGTEHILHGLIREVDGIAGQVLAHYGVTIEKVRTKTFAILGLTLPEGVLMLNHGVYALTPIITDNQPALFKILTSLCQEMSNITIIVTGKKDVV